ncbi:Chemotaxis protein [Candidatus Terasakiella magnetica]|uniref:Chemotaxis protein n=1 Tax=Candidatus Terasakiella magnetica TaxID=1867952 RepID=A0A1C3RKY0_9PROT|nr:protein phosphatase CheZ [Candidatus Terasakiella magnetica]SCA57891.1 Chemotaxis protein [Candidatus Terasakiella magnetica]
MSVPSKVDPDLTARLDELRDTYGDTVKVEEVVEVVDGLLSTMKGDVTSADMELYNELESLADYIHSAKAEIAQLRPDDVKEKYLTSASDELDAIVDATADATNNIMDATEMIEEAMGHVEQEISDKLMDATTKIYEACSFQDITGQRITKVVSALQHIEEKIDALVEAFGSEIDKYKSENPDTEDDAPKEITDEDLLEGPQLDGQGKSQEDIDALLASFD